MKKTTLGLLLAIILYTSCTSSIEENPLKKMQKGLWVPDIEDLFSYKIIRTFADKKDSTFMQRIPFWILGDDNSIITERTVFNHCFDFDLKPNKDGKWGVLGH